MTLRTYLINLENINFKTIYIMRKKVINLKKNYTYFSNVNFYF